MKRFLIYFISALFALSASADRVTLTVQAPATVEAGEQFRVRFTVNSQNVSDFSAPDFKGFEVIYGPATSRQSNFQVINGRSTQSSSITYTYVLVASKPGTYTLSPASIQCDGAVVHSNPLRIRVINAGTGGHGGQQQSSSSGSATVKSVPNAGAISSKDLFMTATASRTHVFEQEAILVTYKLYTLVNLTQLDGKLPTLDGFQIQEIPLPRTKNFQLEQYQGKNYHTVVWSQYVLFPQKAGTLTIPSVTFEGVVVERNANIDPIDAFFNGTSGVIELKKKISTPSLTIHVSELPAQPDRFSGAVGTFTLTSSVSPTEVKTNDAVTLKLNVKGTGNMKLIDTPKVDFPKDFETYDAKVSDHFSLTHSGLSGTKTFEYLVVPRHPGVYEIPATRFVYFDTQTHTYKTLMTQPYTIHVAKGKGNGAQAVSDFTAGQQDVTELNQDIRFIKKGSIASRRFGTSFVSSWWYAACYLVPFLLFIVALIVGRKRIQANANLVALRGRKANRVARKRLRQAQKLMEQKRESDFYEEILRALYGYAADKYNIPQEHLSKENLQSVLQSRGADQSVIDGFLSTLNDCEFARYAPSSQHVTMESIYDMAIRFIRKIEDTDK